MDIVCSILILSLAAGWFFLKEYPLLFGVYVPTGAITRIYFKLIVAAAIVATIVFCGNGDAAANIIGDYGAKGSLSFTAIATVAISALLTMLVLERFSVSASICYSVLGALEGLKLFSVEGSGFNFAMAGSWIAAPAVSLILGALLYLIYKMLFGRSHIHFIKLSYYMRYAVIFGIALSAFALGVNYGGLLTGLAVLTAGSGTIGANLLPAVMVVAMLIIFAETVRRRSDVSADRYFDYTTQTTISVGFAVSATLLLFSSDKFCGLIGLQASPLSVVTLVFAALAGVGLAQGRETVERETLWRAGFGLVLTPLISMLVTYAILFALDADGQRGGDVFDLSIIAFASFLLLMVAFLNYMRRQQRLKAETGKLVYSQQQQLYENQRALNDMELKTILSENQGLHQTLEMKRKEIVNVALSISEQKEYLESLHRLVKELSTAESEAVRQRLVQQIGQSLGQRLSFDQEIDTFYTQAEMLHKDFSVKLTEEFPNLTLQERRLATLLRLGFSSKYIATLMNITPKSVEINRYRLRQKLGLKKGDNLINYIKSI